MNLQTTIDELKIKDIHAMSQNDKYEASGDEIQADHWFGISVAYSGSISMLEETNPDIPAIIEEITERAQTAQENSQAQTDESSKAHANGIAVGSQEVADFLRRNALQPAY